MKVKKRKVDPKIVAVRDDYTGHVIGFICSKEKGGCGAQFGYGKDEHGSTMLFDDWEAECKCNRRGVVAKPTINYTRDGLEGFF